MNQRFEEAKTIYKKLGIDVDEALKQLQTFPVSMHCWQGDDVVGFDGAGALSGGIQTTGNYPGKARNYQELMNDIDEVLKLVPGTKRINLHASYAIFEEGKRLIEMQLNLVTLQNGLNLQRQEI
ncbi:MAG: L-rhamnose isomerase [Coprobacillus cateniformis]